MATHDALVLDGPLGSTLEERGLALPAPLWTAVAVRDTPELVTEVHGESLDAGADVLTTATFRTTARALAAAARAAGVAHDTENWRALVGRAVDLCRAAIAQAAPRADASGRTHVLVAGGIAPLEDCYRPDLTPDDASLLREHGDLARELVDAGVDLLLVETMPTRRELVAATRAAVATGRPVWAALTLGPRGDFFTSVDLLAAAEEVADAGAEALLVNCTSPRATTRALEALAESPSRPARLGAYANVLYPRERDGSPETYAAHAARWLQLGATLVGGCCGTGVEHLRALRRLVEKG